MADGTRLNNASTNGDLIWTEDTGAPSGKIQRMKLVKGALDNDGGDIEDTNPLPIKSVAVVSGGLQKYHVVTAASVNAANVKASPGQVYKVRVYNNADYPIYVKLHNTAGTPSAGVGVVETIGVQAGTRVFDELVPGDEFTTGIGITIVKGIADNDATAVALNDGVVDVFYK